MTYVRQSLNDDPGTLPRMPSWVTGQRAETLEDVAFLSGAALAALHIVVGRDEVPHALLRDRLALRAAGACARFSGRMERAGELRDEVRFLRPGDQAGSAGVIYLQWQQPFFSTGGMLPWHKTKPCCKITTTPEAFQ